MTEHKAWLESKGEQGACADLMGVSLRGADLDRARLLEAKL